MQEFEKILLDVWRVACQNLGIQASVKNIAEMLIDHMPLEQLVMFRLDFENKDIEIMAYGFQREQSTLSYGKICVAPPFPFENIQLCERKHYTSTDKAFLLILNEIDSVYLKLDTIFSPLCKNNKPIGLMLFIGQQKHKFSEKHKKMIQILSEPMIVALENDLYLRELKILRDAAEAEKQFLLKRLSRKSLTDEIIGAESGLKSVMERIHLVAKSDVPVMIFGETGTGKELISRELHRLSKRANGPFLRVNCGAIPPELVDSQLFGHEKGAFTGAIETRKGWFERADGGTLFLDEIAELGKPAQVRLLRILQDGWMERVGGKHPIRVDVRVIVATHCNLQQMVVEKQFREDLWYRLAVFPIILPPLRDRKQDIPTLAAHFAERAALRFTLPLQKPTPLDIELLSSYDWPGNIREFASVIDRAAILGDGQGLQVAKALGGNNIIFSKQKNNEKEESFNFEEQKVTLDDIVKTYIAKTLKKTKGRIEGPHGAAVILDINPHTLRAKIRKLGLDWRLFR